MKELLKELGPLAALEGKWEGAKGDDIAPGDDRGIENNKFKEVMVFERLSRVDNHEQTLYGLRYRTTAWRLGEPDPFHEEVGYWLWDAKAGQVYRCFIVPRGVNILAGGSAEAHSTAFTLSAELGSPTFGISSNPFLHEEFKTVRYDLKVDLSVPGTLTYEEDTVLQMKGRKELFHHTDKNTLKKV